jgi:hypothetical protein
VVTLNGRVQTEDVEGVVESVNGTGLKIAGAWVNVSRFKPVPLPDAGAHVRLKVDSKGYIVDLEQLSNGTTPAVLSAKDDRITRLAVLKAAANFLGQMSQTREEVRSEHVLVLADRWLKWVEEET